MMAHRIARLMFVAGGAVFPNVAEAAAAFLDAGQDVSPVQRMGLLEASAALAAGTSDARQFCASAAELCAAPSEAASQLYECLAERLDAHPGMSSLMGELARTSEVFLVSDYPRDWLMPALARSGLEPYCPADKITYTAGLGGYGGLFERLVAAGVILRGHTLWIDAHSRRTSEALRRGIDAAIFVDARRLRRDLGLWGLAPR